MAFSITVDGTSYTIDTEIIGLNVDERRCYNKYSWTYQTPFGERTEEHDAMFTAPELTQALSDIGQQTFSTLNQFGNSMLAIAEQLARNRWED